MSFIGHVRGGFWGADLRKSGQNGKDVPREEKSAAAGVNLARMGRGERSSE